MLEGWRLKLREAERAVSENRLEDAARLLYAPELRSVRKASSLARQVALRLAQDAARHHGTGNIATAWRFLDLSKVLGGETSEYLAARDELIVSVLARLEEELAAGKPDQVLTGLHELERHQVAGPTLARFHEAARRLAAGQRLATRGLFQAAQQQLEPIPGLVSACGPAVARLAEEYRQNGFRFQALETALRRHMQARDWKQAEQVADELTRLAPDNPDLAEVRRRIVARVSDPSAFDPRAELEAWNKPAEEREARRALADLARNGGLETARVGDPSYEHPRGGDPSYGSRFLMWVDAVGGFLVCLADEVLLGKAMPDCRVDIALQGDLSRRHAKIARQGEAYWIDVYQTVKLDGHPIRERTLLTHGDELEIGGVRLRFCQPHALSRTARLEIVSRHRTQPAVDAVLLMAESCVLGPAWRNHVVCRDWARDLIIYRQGDDLFCRSSDTLEIDGRIVTGRGRLTRHSRLVGHDFSLSLEELDKWTN